ncbi:hypothetical protein [Vibrio sp. CK2-1]|uniref:hypothetical protein n=1 Tax=Vibrio sp. CK2-1 TaxID=2912249 RepID=UPI001F36DA67|nr:hypothetical protein [Vibrio sp. CK2-1]MCF7354242.1 hypothetical protein [Vibrio sp. CK2-1]
MLNHFSSTSLLSKQRGAATLLVAVLLLASVLVLSLASYKGVFFQAKRAQNEVEARQLHWKGEGRLECVMAKVVQTSPSPISGINFSNCDNSSNINISPVTGHPNLYIVTSNESNYLVSKVIKVPKSGATGALMANADLYLQGTSSIRPQPIELLGSNYSCVSARYSQNIFVNGNWVTSIPQGTSNIGCDAIYTSTVTGSTPPAHLSEANDQNELLDDGIDESSFKEDFLFTENLDPFQELFGVPRNEYTSIKQQFYQVNGSSMCSGATCTCDENIANAINDSEVLIWVNGSCDLGSASAIADEDTSEGIILVVENGLLATTGSVPFDGVLFQFIHGISFDIDMWDGFSGESFVDSVNVQTGIVPVIFMAGSKVPDGLLVIDAPGNIGVINGSISLSYNKSKIENPLGQLLKPKWLKGSWNDF